MQDIGRFCACQRLLVTVMMLRPLKRCPWQGAVSLQCLRQVTTQDKINQAGPGGLGDEKVVGCGGLPVVSQKEVASIESVLPPSFPVDPSTMIT